MAARPISPVAQGGDMANRRIFLGAAAQAGAAAFLLAPASHAAQEGKQVSAAEDLMREHGVLRRALLVYQAASERLAQGGGLAPVAALRRTAQLFRAFGEDYHERRLEETLIFPAVRKLKGPIARYPDILQTQHERGRELTGYVLAVARGPKIATADMAPLARALHEFVVMYEHHAAREDTDLFPAWKQSLSADAYKEIGEQFETIEKEVFGHDGFEDAVKRIAAAEREFGLADLRALTMSKLPKPAAA
jgi:hemerythrin-like domain-containing protein